ncbi:hypothetical protein, partial [Propylenella binzhouense]
MTTETNGRTGAELAAALDRFGSDLARWPDGAPAAEARAALLGDRAFRGSWEVWRDVEQSLDAARAACDAEIARSGALERIRA